LEYGVPTYEADGPVVLPKRQQVEGGQGDPVGSVGVAAVVGVNGVLGEDVGVLYELSL
jgi:hypothetical protein